MDSIFNIIKEIDSISRSIKNTESEVYKQSQRTQKIALMIEKREGVLSEQLESLRQSRLELINAEAELEKNYDLLQKRQEQLNGILSEREVHSLQEEIQNTEELVSTLEENIISKTEYIEELQQEAQDSQSFIRGAGETIQEITEELKEEFAPLFREVEHKKQRVQDLKEELPEKELQLLENLLKQNLKDSILSKLQNGCCHYCGFSVPALQQQEIKDFKITSCSACKRILMS